MSFLLKASLVVNSATPGAEMVEFLAGLPAGVELRVREYRSSQFDCWELFANIELGPESMGKVVSVLQESKPA